MKDKINNIKKVLYYAVPVILFLWCAQTVFNNSIWLDEAFSLSIIKQSFIDIVKNTAIDVHPPLYYIILKIIVSVVGESRIIYVSKLVSMVPIIILIIISYKEISKLLGKKVAFLFNILILGMPQIMRYGIEIRMYSLGMLFVTLVYISCIKWRRENTYRELYKMAIFALLSAYTHYFALVSVACIYGVIILEIIIRKDWKNLKAIFFSIFIIFIFYLPWLIILTKQLLTVKESYWIGEITKNTLKAFFQYPYTIEGSNALTNIIAIILLISIIPIRNTNNKIAIYGFLVPIGTIAIGVIASKLIRPIFISRYMVCGLGCLWLAVAIKISAILKKEYMYSVVVAIVIGVTICNNYNLIEKEKLYKDEQLKLISYMDSLNENDIIIFDSHQLQRIVAYYYPNIKTYVYKQEITQLTKQVYRQTNMEKLSNIKEIEELDGNVYVFTMNESILNELYSYNYEKYGEYSIETYKFNTYKLK